VLLPWPVAVVIVDRRLDGAGVVQEKADDLETVTRAAMAPNHLALSTGTVRLVQPRTRSACARTRTSSPSPNGKAGVAC